MRSKKTFKDNIAVWVLHLMLLYLGSTLLQGLFPFSLNRVVSLFVVAVIICYDIFHLTKWRIFLCAYIAFGAGFTSLNASEISLNMKDWFHFAKFLLFVDFVSEDSICRAFATAIEGAEKSINAITLAFCVLTLLSLMIPSSYDVHWGGDTYFFGFAGDPHVTAYSLSLLATLRLIAYRGKPFSVIDLCQLVFIMAAIFMTGARTYIIPIVIIIYSYMEKKIQNKNTKKVMYGLVLLAILVILMRSNMVEKFSWTGGWNPTNMWSWLIAVTSGRMEFWTIDLWEFAKSSWVEKLFGCGFDHVYLTNLQYVEMKIWAHNDLIHLLLGSGVVSIFVYIAAWSCFARRYQNYIKSQLLRWCVLVYIVFPMMFNGVFVHTHYLMSIFVFVFFLAFENEIR